MRSFKRNVGGKKQVRCGTDTDLAQSSKPEFENHFESDPLSEYRETHGDVDDTVQFSETELVDEAIPEEDLLDTQVAVNYSGDPQHLDDLIHDHMIGVGTELVDADDDIVAMDSGSGGDTEVLSDCDTLSSPEHHSDREPHIKDKPHLGISHHGRPKQILDHAPHDSLGGKPSDVSNANRVSGISDNSRVIESLSAGKRGGGGGDGDADTPVHHLPSDNDFTGLSYIDSQKPGESTQTIALDFVDRFIESNVPETDHDVQRPRSSGSKSKFRTSSRGPQILARMNSDRNAHCRGTVVYEWDDNAEDDGGGDLFIRKKDEFFTTRTRKSRMNRADRLRLIQSDAKAVSNRTAIFGETKRNLITEFDEDAGADTQMAVEAMEALRASSLDRSKKKKKDGAGVRKSSDLSGSGVRRRSFVTRPQSPVASRTRKKAMASLDSEDTMVVERRRSSVRTGKKPRCDETARATDGMVSTPASCVSPPDESSPICMGSEYSCKKNLMKTFLSNELRRLGDDDTTSPTGLRRRRDMANVRVLFSRHLDEDEIKQQKKILGRLGAAATTSVSEATHFVTDQFVRTRNMLEAIASGKPVVTHLWLESCGQASCFIDEKNYILRDAKKEKEFGFSMPFSLARASNSPLLQGLRVLITPNTKPGKEIMASLVKALNGQIVERLGRSAMKDGRIPSDLIVVSCQEDHALCVPFLEKGASVYGSELILNGIVTQRLEHVKHRLFVDEVRKTRSSVWLKQDNVLRVLKK